MMTAGRLGVVAAWFEMVMMRSLPSLMSAGGRGAAPLRGRLGRWSEGGGAELVEGVGDALLVEAGIRHHVPVGREADRDVAAIATDPMDQPHAIDDRRHSGQRDCFGTA